MRLGLLCIPLVLALGCEAPVVDDVLWRCTTSSDCGSGYVCDVAAERCFPADEDGLNGVFASEVRFGAVLPLSAGPTDVGRALRLGIEAAFARSNQAGGIYGRRVSLTVRDSAYDLETALLAMGELTDSRSVLAVIGDPGGHVTDLLAARLVDREIIFLALSGAVTLGAPTVFAVGGDHTGETRALVDHLTGTVGVRPANLALLVQATASGRIPDPHGAPVVAGVRAALAAQGLDIEPLVLLSSARTREVADPVRALLAWLAAPERTVTDGGIRAAIVLGVEDETASRFVREASEALAAVVDSATDATRWGISAEERERLAHVAPLRFAAVGDVGASAWLAGIEVFGQPDLCTDLLMAQTQPFFGGETPLQVEFRSDLGLVDEAAEPTASAFRGYRLGRQLVDALRVQGPEISPESFITTLESMAVFDPALAEGEGLSAEDHRFFENVSLMQTNGACEWGPL